MKHKEAENMGLKEELFQQILSRFATSEALRTMGITVAYLGVGIVRLKMKVKPEYLNAMGIQHGGFTCALADTAMGIAVQTLGSIGYTIDLNINFCAPVVTGDELVAEGQVIYEGGTSLVAEATIYTMADKLVAKSRGAFMRPTSAVSARIR